MTQDNLATKEDERVNPWNEATGEIPAILSIWTENSTGDTFRVIMIANNIERTYLTRHYQPTVIYTRGDGVALAKDIGHFLSTMTEKVSCNTCNHSDTCKNSTDNKICYLPLTQRGKTPHCYDCSHVFWRRKESVGLWLCDNCKTIKASRHD